MTANPFRIDFGRLPTAHATQLQNYNTITDTFDEMPSSSNSYGILGVRGSGKTVLLNQIIDHYEKQPKWIHVSLNADDDILHALLIELANHPKLKKWQLDSKLHIQIPGLLSLDVSEKNELNPPHQIIKNLLALAKTKGYRILITIDDIGRNKSLPTFGKYFQEWLRHYDIYCIITALHDHLKYLRDTDDDSTSFLYRLPTVESELIPFDDALGLYQQYFPHLDDETTVAMAKLGRGYMFAFQIIGYIMWRHHYTDLDQALPEIKNILYRRAYDKIWDDLSVNDQKLLSVLSPENQPRKTIEKALGWTSGYSSVYRQRLIKNGLIDSDDYGAMRLTLPLFDQFIKNPTLSNPRKSQILNGYM